MVRGPMIAEVTAGWLITKASARWISGHAGLLGQHGQLLGRLQLGLVAGQAQVVALRVSARARRLTGMSAPLR